MALFEIGHESVPRRAGQTQGRYPMTARTATLALLPLTATPWRQAIATVVRARIALVLAAYVLYDEPQRSQEIAEEVDGLTDWCLATIEAGRPRG